MVAIWNYYLTYSIALGISSIAGKEISNFFGPDIFNSEYIEELDDIMGKTETKPNNMEEFKVQFEKDYIEEQEKYNLKQNY